MYKIMLFNPLLKNFLRILWQDSIDDVQTYQLNTVPYGTANFPYFATHFLKNLTLNEKPNLLLASSVILKNFKLDDLLSGESNFKRANIFKFQLIDFFKLGNMNLNNWCVNIEHYFNPILQLLTIIILMFKQILIRYKHFVL